MDLSDFLKNNGATVDATIVHEIVENILRAPAATPSDLVEALAVTLNPCGARVIIDPNGAVDSGLAGKVVTFLLRSGEIRIDGRHVQPAREFGSE